MPEPGSLFDILGPVMIGPSSSHTAGAVRLGQMVRHIARMPIRKVDFVLYNSLAKTYQGHGTDKGLLAGILGLHVFDDAIRTAFERAEAMGLEYRFTPYLESNGYSPNTVRFEVTLQTGEALTVLGHSTGGGKVNISQINADKVALRGDYPALILKYRDQPGMIWQVTKVIAEQQVNIASLTCTRQQKGTQAFMTILLDNPLSQPQEEAIRQIGEIYTVRYVEPLLS